MTYALREARALAVDALAAPIPRKMALTAHAALGLSTDPFHAHGSCVTPSCSLCAARHAHPEWHSVRAVWATRQAGCNWPVWLMPGERSCQARPATTPRMTTTPMAIR